LLKIIGTTPIDGVWYKIPNILTKSGTAYNCPKKFNLLSEEVFRNMDQKDRDKIATPLMEANCYWHPADYMKFIQTMIDYNNHGGKKIPNSWNGASWERFCTNLNIKDPVWRAQITLKQLILVIIYNFWNGDLVVDVVKKLKLTTLGWFGPEKALTNYRTWREKLEEHLHHLDYSATNMLNIIEPNIVSSNSFDKLKTTIQTKASTWSSWDEMFDAVEVVCNEYDEMFKKRFVSCFGG